MKEKSTRVMELFSSLWYNHDHGIGAAAKRRIVQQVAFKSNWWAYGLKIQNKKTVQVSSDKTKKKSLPLIVEAQLMMGREKLSGRTDTWYQR